MAQINLQNKFLPLVGGTLTGNLNMASGANVLTTLSGINTIGSAAFPFEAVYANNIISSGVGGAFVHISGDTMTGTLNAPVISGTVISGNNFYAINISGQSYIFTYISGSQTNDTLIKDNDSIGLNIGSKEVYIHNLDETGYFLVQSDVTYVDSGGITLITASGLNAFTITDSLITSEHSIVPLNSGTDNLGGTSRYFNNAYINNLNASTSIQLNGNNVIVSGNNLGSATQLFASKSGNNLNFRTISGLGNVAITNDASVVYVSGTQFILPTNVVQSASSSGTGFGVFNSQVGSNLIFNSISGNGNITVTSIDGLINISGATVSPESTTASNSGTGFVVFNSQNGSNLVFNTVSGNGNVTVSSLNGVINVSGNSFATIAVTAPITNTVGIIGITTASTSTSGSLTSTDWNTFNTGATNATNALGYIATVSGNLVTTNSNLATVSGIAATAIQSGISLGTGLPIFSDKNGTNLRFNSISGAGIATVTLAANLLTVSVPNQSGSTLTAPASTTDTAIVLWSGSVGTGLLNSIPTVNTTTGRINAPSFSGTDILGILVSGTQAIFTNISGSNALLGPTPTVTANSLVRFSGTDARLTNASPVTVDDTGALIFTTGGGSISAPSLNIVGSIGAVNISAVGSANLQGTVSSRLNVGGVDKLFVNSTTITASNTIVPNISGSYNIGTAALPFASGSFNNLQISGNNVIVSGTNLSTGFAIFAQKNVNNLEFNTISGVGAVAVTQAGNVLIFSGTDTGESNTASNLGTGYGWFAGKVGVDLQFRSVISGSNIVLTSGTNDIAVGVYDSPVFTAVYAGLVSGNNISGNTATITTINNTTLNGNLGIFTTVSGVSNIYGTSASENIQFNSTSGVYVRSNTGTNGLVLESSVKPVQIFSPSGMTLQWSESIAYPNYSIVQASGATANNSVTTIQTIPTDSNSVYLIEARILGRRTGGSSGTANDSATYIRTARIKNTAGTVTINNLQSDYTSEDQAGWDVTITASSPNCLIRVNGATNNNVSWNITTKIQRLT